MSPQMRVMLLIDADNVSPDVMEQAVEKVLFDRGAIHVRRAYCTPESALSNHKLFKAWSIRPIVNLSTGKNATDICLAVDAMDLVMAERPDLVVIVSSDSDFAPLVIRLREKGCRVEGIGQLGKTGEDSKGVYDGFVDIEHRRSGRSPSAALPAARKRAPAGRGSGNGGRGGRASAPSPVPVPTSAPLPPPAPAPTPAPVAVQEAAPERAAPTPAAAKRGRGRSSREAASPAPAALTEADVEREPAVTAEPEPVSADAPKPKRTRRSKSEAADLSPDAATAAPSPARARAPAPAPAPAARPVMPDDLRSILAVLPELVRGQKMDLGIATERLRSEELLGERAPATRLFRKYPDWFLLSPEQQPNKVEYLGLPKA